MSQSSECDQQGKDVGIKLAEIGVGEEPRCVAIHPNDQVAYVTNGISGTVSVVNLAAAECGGDDPCRHRATGLRADAERNAALCREPHGRHRNHHRHCLRWRLVGKVAVGRNPTALAITNNGNGDDADETVFVTQIFAELNPDFNDPTFNGNGEMRDLGKRGVLYAFAAGNANPQITKITLAPLADSGFSASRTNFCPKAVDPQPHLLSFARTRLCLELTL